VENKKEKRGEGNFLPTRKEGGKNGREGGGGPELSQGGGEKENKRFSPQPDKKRETSRKVCSSIRREKGRGSFRLKENPKSH